MKATKITQKIKNFKNISLLLTIGLALAAGLTFAWNAVWHGTDWIKNGTIIDAQKIAENFEYLKQRIEEIETGTTTSLSIHPTWPDVIICRGNKTLENYSYYGDIGETPLYYGGIYYPNGNAVVWYAPTEYGDARWIGFLQSTGEFYEYQSGWWGMEGCINKHINQLIQEGRAFDIPVVLASQISF